MRVAFSWPWKRSIFPLAWVWYAVQHILLEPWNLAKLLNSSDSDCTPLSVAIVIGVPKIVTQICMKTLATVSTVMFAIGTAIRNLVNWSIHVNKWLKPFECGKRPIKSIRTRVKRAPGCDKTAMCKFVWWITLDYWHAEHFLTKLCTSFCKFDHICLALISLVKAFAPEWDKEWRLININFRILLGRKDRGNTFDVSQ